MNTYVVAGYPDLFFGVFCFINILMDFRVKIKSKLVYLIAKVEK